MKIRSYISDHPFIFLISVMVISSICLGSIFAIVGSRGTMPDRATEIAQSTDIQNTLPINTSHQLWTTTELEKTPSAVIGTLINTEIIITETQIPATKTPLNGWWSFTVHFVDVGQGDAIFIITPTGEKILIDGGSEDSGLTEYLNLLEILNINTIIATHPHEDHIGGLIQVLEGNKKVKQVYTNGEIFTTSIFEHFIDAIANAGAEYYEVKRGDMIEAGGISFNVLSPDELSGDDTNHNSLVLRMSYGEITFLFMGDADINAENEIMTQNLPVKADILKIGHHGSCTSTDEKFLKAVAPDVAVTSVGKNSQYGLPCDDINSRLQNAGIKTFDTGTEGTIVIHVDPSGYTVNNMYMQELWSKP